MLRTFLALLLSFWVALVGAEEPQPIPPLTARFTDLTATLSADQRSQLEARLAAFEKEKGAQITVLIVPTVKPEAIEQYSIRVVEQWKLGRKGVDDGVLLLIAKQDKKLRIEVGYGLEGALNDATARRIIAESITPRFKEGKFYEGINAGVERIVAVIGGEALPAPKPAPAQGSSGSTDTGFDFETILIVGLVLVTVVAGILRAIFGRFFGSAMVGGIAGFIAMLVVSSMIVAGIVGVVAFVLALLSGGRGGGSGWSSGGWSGGSSGGSWGSSGGFSGGGGGFGGGGASGDW